MFYSSSNMIIKYITNKYIRQRYRDVLSSDYFIKVYILSNNLLFLAIYTIFYLFIYKIWQILILPHNRCDDGWTGNDCEESKSFLPKELRDSFSEEPLPNKYALIVGGMISDLCGPLASGSSMHFYGVSTWFYALSICMQSVIIII